MSWADDLRKLVEAKFKAEFTLIEDRFIDYGENNNTFVKPTDGSAWCRVVVKVLDNENAEIGTKMQRARGILTVQIFTEFGSGESESNNIAGSVGDIFQNTSFNGLNIFAMTPLKIGANNGWFQQNAKFDFYYNVFS